LSNPKTILLTGANGFLGSYLLEALIQKGYDTIVLKRTTSNLWRILHLNGLYKAYDVDVDPVEKAFQENRIDVVIHTACCYGRKGESIKDVVESNLIYSLRIIDACIKYNTDTFFNTDTLLQKHLNVYTLSKKQFVEWLKLYSLNINVINLKLEHVYGPKDDISKFVPWILEEFKKNVPEIKLTKGEQMRDFVYIYDVVDAFMKVIENVSNCLGYNEIDIGTGELVTLREFIENLHEKFYLKFELGRVHLGFGLLQYREGEIMIPKLDNTKLLNLGWRPRFNYKRGIDDYLSKINF
jgi:CDP-paratose synthetase